MKAAATIVVISRCQRVLLVKRSAKSAFFPATFVFPGGKLEKEDCISTNNTTAFPSVPDIKETLPLSHTPIKDAQHAALRELYEESGLLLAFKSNYQAVIVEPKLEQRGKSFQEIVNQTGIRLPHLMYWSRWITPREEKKRRFDTAFFLVQVDGIGSTVADGVEVDKTVWMKPSEAVCKVQRGEMYLAPPTWYVLEQLNKVDFAVHQRVETFMPILYKIPREKDVVIWGVLPGDDAYRLSEPLTTKAFVKYLPKKTHRFKWTITPQGSGPPKWQYSLERSTS